MESLKQAKHTLDDLADELADEVREQSGESPADRGDTTAESQTENSGRQREPAAGSRSPGNTRLASDQSEQSEPSNSAGPSSPSQSLLRSGGREGGTSAASGHRPLTGSDFRGWSDRLREVEELLEDNELRQQAARVRDRARAMRSDFHRHGTEPQWELVESELLDEMRSLQNRLTQEILAAESDRSMVPIDREPVPEAFDELVQRYYELLGRERVTAQPQEPTE